MTPPTDGQDVIFYDGHCGLCHRTVKWVLREDAAGERFVFAPLQGDFIKQYVSDAERASLPDSIIVRTGDGRLLMRSSAIVHILDRLGHRFRAGLLGAIPRAVRDLGYNTVARVRHLLFARPNEACPMMPPELRGRFRF